MAVTTYWYAKAFISVFNKEIDWQSGAKINASLHTSSYVPNQDTHQYHSSLTNQLSTANGYTAEDGSDTGFPVVSPAITNTLNVLSLDSGDPQWTATGAGFTAAQIVLMDVTSGVSATDPLILWSDFGANETASGGGTFTYTVNASGWASITPADATGFP
jgi:hypothetical protein